MISQLIIDSKYGNAGIPVRFCDWLPGQMVEVELPSGEIVQIESAAVSSGEWTPEETLSVLSDRSGIREDTLLKAAQSGRLMARKSGATWLSTLNAVEWAIAKNKIRKRERKNVN